MIPRNVAETDWDHGCDLAKTALIINERMYVIGNNLILRMNEIGRNRIR